MKPAGVQAKHYPERTVMKKIVLSVLGFGFVLTMICTSESLAGQRRRAVVVTPRPVHRPAVIRTRLVVGPRYPIRRVFPTTVVVRPARRTVLVGAPLVYLPPLRWKPAVVSTPAAERLVWEDSEMIEREEGWVDSNFGVDSTGNALFLQIDGTAELNFAEVAFANGNVQLWISTGALTDRECSLLNFSDGRQVRRFGC